MRPGVPMASKRAWFVDTDEEIAATEETESTSDRAAAIVIASLVETRLTIALQMELHQEPKIIEKLFRPSGPIGSFSAKIDLAYLMGIVSEQAHKDLVNMKNIRNMFAHEMKPWQACSSRLWDLSLLILRRKAQSVQVGGSPVGPNASCSTRPSRSMAATVSSPTQKKPRTTGPFCVPAMVGAPGLEPGTR